IDKSVVMSGTPTAAAGSEITGASLGVAGCAGASLGVAGGAGASLGVAGGAGASLGVAGGAGASLRAAGCAGGSLRAAGGAGGSLRVVGGVGASFGTAGSLAGSDELFWGCASGVSVADGPIANAVTERNARQREMQSIELKSFFKFFFIMTPHYWAYRYIFNFCMLS
ncbi:MAG: hypothetical protein RR994_04380, partial [Clostridia bacterium]